LLYAVTESRGGGLLARNGKKCTDGALAILSLMKEFFFFIGGLL